MLFFNRIFGNKNSKAKNKAVANLDNPKVKEILDLNIFLMNYCLRTLI